MVPELAALIQKTEDEKVRATIFDAFRSIAREDTDAARNIAVMLIGLITDAKTDTDLRRDALHRFVDDIRDETAKSFMSKPPW